MIIVPPITINASNLTSNAPVENYPTWGEGDVHLKAYETFTTTPESVWENFLTKDVYVVLENTGTIYKQTEGKGPFLEFLSFPSISGFLTGNWATGFLYIYAWTRTVNDTAIQCYVRINAKTGEYEELPNPSNRFPTGSIAVNSSTNEVFAVFSGIPGTRYLYKMANGASTFSPHGSDMWTVQNAYVEVDSGLGDIYVVRTEGNGTSYAGVYTGGGTTLTPVTGAGNGLNRICVNEITHDVFISAFDGFVWERPAGTGNFVMAYAPYGPFGSITLLFSSGINLAQYIRRSAYPHGLATISNKMFQKDDYVIQNYQIYLSLVDGNRENPSLDTVGEFWFRYSATNPFKLVDEQTDTVTTAPTGTGLIMTLANSGITAIGFFNTKGDYVTVTLTVDDNVVYNVTQNLYDNYTPGDPTVMLKDLVFDNIPYHASGSFDITIGFSMIPVSCGRMVAGVAHDIGITQRDMKVSFQSYSAVVTDDFGRTTFTKRGRSKRLTCNVYVHEADIGKVNNIIADNDAALCMWITSKYHETYSLVYGFYKMFDMTVNSPSGAKYSIELLGAVGDDSYIYAVPNTAITFPLYYSCQDNANDLTVLCNESGKDGQLLNGYSTADAHDSSGKGLHLSGQTMIYVGPYGSDTSPQHTVFFTANAIPEVHTGLEYLFELKGLRLCWEHNPDRLTLNINGTMYYSDTGYTIDFAMFVDTLVQLLIDVGTAYLYINNVLVATFTNIPSPTPTQVEFTVGGMMLSPNSNFKGFIKDIWYWNSLQYPAPH